MSNKEYNYGLCALKLWMAFEVVYLHTGGSFSIWMITAVPVFMMLSFFLSTDGIYKDLTKRMKRLVFPYIAWSLINYGILGVMGLTVAPHLRPTIRGFFSQLICGTADLDSNQMWFLNNLILLSLMMYGLYRLAGRKFALIIFMILGCFCIIYEKLGWDLAVQGYVQNKDRLWMFAGLITLPEMIPFAAMGLFLCETGVLIFLKKWRYLSLALAIVLFIRYRSIPHVITRGGWLYGGLEHIIVAALLVAIFYLLPLEKLPEAVLHFIKFLGRYTMGIFLCHIIVKQLYEILLSDSPHLLHGIPEAVTVFSLSWLICAILDALIPKWGKRLVT